MIKTNGYKEILETVKERIDKIRFHNTSPVIAISYDFDGTLAAGNMQEHSFIPEIGRDKDDFWNEVNKIAKEVDGDTILVYMELMLKEAKRNNKVLSKEALKDYGSKIQLFDGVEDYFNEINEYALKKGAMLSHYIISSGLRDIIEGTPIRKHFTNVFASGFKFNDKGIAEWPALAVNYTNKTQFLFRINKGIENSWDNSVINKYLLKHERPVQFRNMIYIGDGETDVPCMRLLKDAGGCSIAVYDPNRNGNKELCETLLVQGRCDKVVKV